MARPMGGREANPISIPKKGPKDKNSLRAEQNTRHMKPIGIFIHGARTTGNSLTKNLSNRTHRLKDQSHTSLPEVDNEGVGL